MIPSNLFACRRLFSRASIVRQSAPSLTLPAVINGEITKINLDSLRNRYYFLLFYPLDL